MTSLFISYSRKDIETAKKLTEAFKGQDLDFWIDWEGIPPTVDWWKEIERGIEQANVFVFLISPDSAKSKICGQEIDHAVKNGKRLIPVVVRDVKAEESPTDLQSLNWIFLRDGDNFDQNFTKLITAIKTDYEWVQIHSQLQIKALEWERNNHENSFLLRGRELQAAEIQLATNSSKEPYPTDLQREYVLKSRQSTDQLRRITTSISVAAVIALTALTIFGFLQEGYARNAQAAAEANLSVALTAQVDAQNKESARATQQALAEERANIALARQLAAQAEVVDNSNFYDGIYLPVLLYIQSMKLYPTNNAASFLINNSYVAQQHNDRVNAVAFSPDSKYIVSGSGDHTVRVWEVATGKEIARMQHDDWVYSVAFSPNGKLVASGSQDGTVCLWETLTGRKAACMYSGGPAASVTFTPNGEYLISGSDTSVWELSTDRQIYSSNDGPVLSIAISPNGNYIASANLFNTVFVREAITGKEVAHMKHDDVVNSVAFSPDSQYVISGSDDRTVRVWEATTGKEVARMTHDSGVRSVAISPNGKYVVSGSDDHTARVWETTTGKEIARAIHDLGVTSATFSPDGKYVISGSADLTARIWELATGKEVVHIIHDDEVTVVTFSPNSKYVASGSKDGIVRISEWQADDLIVNACALMPFNLNRDQWAQYIGSEFPYQEICPNLPPWP